MNGEFRLILTPDQRYTIFPNMVSELMIRMAIIAIVTTTATTNNNKGNSTSSKDKSG